MTIVHLRMNVFINEKTKHGQSSSDIFTSLFMSSYFGVFTIKKISHVGSNNRQSLSLSHENTLTQRKEEEGQGAGLLEGADSCDWMLELSVSHSWSL